MASKDHASIAAATTAGYKEIVTDRGASFSPASRRFIVVLEKMLVGAASEGQFRSESSGEGSTQAAAEAVALAALNNKRANRYGFDTAVSVSPRGGGAHTTDVT